MLVWLGHHRKIKPPGLFALYVAGYSAYRIFEESLRVDSSVYIFGLRLNMYIATVLAIIGAVWFWRSQRRPAPVVSADAATDTDPAGNPDSAAAADSADPGVAAAVTPATSSASTGSASTTSASASASTASTSASASTTSTSASAASASATSATSGAPSSPDPEPHQPHDSQQATS